jgi:hypothetical protein
MTTGHFHPKKHVLARPLFWLKTFPEEMLDINWEVDFTSNSCATLIPAKPKTLRVSAKRRTAPNLFIGLLKLPRNGPLPPLL